MRMGNTTGTRKPGHHKHRRTAGFTLVELTGSMMILVLLFGCFYTALRGVHEAHDRFASETYAIVLLGNVIERVRGETRRDAAAIDPILRDEYEKSPLGGSSRTHAVCTETASRVVIEVRDTRDVSLARVEVPR